MKVSFLSILVLLLAFTSLSAQEGNQPVGALVVSTDKDQTFLIKPDGSIIRKLADFGSNSIAWSPDGCYIALGAWSSRVNLYDLFVVKYDGSDLRNLTNQNQRVVYSGIQWSPDGTMIAFTRFDNLNSDVYVIRSDGGNLTNLTDSQSKNWNPTWFPDGKQLAFESDRDGNWEIYVVDVDGKNLQNLTNDNANDRYPSRSPSDSLIAFISDRSGKDALYLMDPDGQNVKLLFQLQDIEAEYTLPLWSPDGSKILLLLYWAPITFIYVIDCASQDAQNLAGGWFSDYGLQWSPDGQYIAFRRQAIGPGDELKMNTNGIYTMRSDGTELTRINNWYGILAWGMPPSYFALDISGKLKTSWGKIKQ